MRILIAASGSYGDIYPFLGIGRELKSRGHDVRFFSSTHFTPLAEELGLQAIGIGTPEAYEEAIRHPDAFHPRRGIRVIAEVSLRYLPDTYRSMEEHVSAHDTVVLCSTLALGARLLRETRAIPTATVHLAPSIFRSAERPPRFMESGFPGLLPPFVHRALFWLVDTLAVDPLYCPGFNRFRSEIGLPPIRRIFGDWMHESDLVIGLFPDWFGRPQRDWPRNLRLTGFPLYDGSREPALAPEAAAFLEGARHPVLFTAGTAATSARSFFEESAEACRIAGIEGLLITRYPEQLPRELPPRVRHFGYLPFSLALPRAAAVVHHGGIGTSSQALRAGRPQLVRPLAFDQFDNAQRLQELGVARWLSTARYRARAVAEALEELLRSKAVREAASSAKKRIEEGGDAVAATCDLVLGLINKA